MRSSQYRQAVALVSRVHGWQGQDAERMAEAERVSWIIADLARQAPVEEALTIKRMNSSLARLIEALGR